MFYREDGLQRRTREKSLATSTANLPGRCTVADARLLALVWDALVEVDMAGNHYKGLEATQQGTACGASMVLVPPRTAAVKAAIRASGCSQVGTGCSQVDDNDDDD